MSETEKFNCVRCGEHITGAYGSIGGNIVPYVAAKCYHMRCVPTVSELTAGYYSTGERI